MLALLRANPGEVLDGSKRVKDFAVCTADGRGFPFPEALLDILSVEDWHAAVQANVQVHRQR